MRKEDYIWVDSFIKNIRPYVFVRPEDGVLIKKPNVAQKINETGAVILQYLLSGNSIVKLFAQKGFDEARQLETMCFIRAVKDSLEGNLDFGTCNPAVDKKSFTAPFSFLPVLSELALTSRCNLRCSFCYAGINCNRKEKSVDLSVKDLKTLIYKIRHEAKVPSISFTGGEPTLRKEIFDLITYAKKLDMRVNLISNGTLIDVDFARRLKKAGLDTAQISIEAPTADLHDEICGVGGSFAKSIEAIKNLQNQDIRVHGNTTLSAQNSNVATDFPAFYKSIGMERFSMNLVIPVGSVMEHRSVQLTYEEVSKTIQTVLKASDKAGIEFMWYSPVPLRLFNTITAGLGNKGCAACDGLLSVDSSGNILPCSSWEEPVGNLLVDSFENIWNSKRAVHIRSKKEAPKACEGCDSFQVCQGACPLYWKLFGESELNNYCLKTSHTYGKDF